MFSLLNGFRESAGGELPRDDPPAQADPPSHLAGASRGYTAGGNLRGQGHGGEILKQID